MAPTIANNNIKEVIINKINKLVYNKLPSEAICVTSTNKVSHDLLLTVATAVTDINLITDFVVSLLKTVNDLLSTSNNPPKKM